MKFAFTEDEEAVARTEVCLWGLTEESKKVAVEGKLEVGKNGGAEKPAADTRRSRKKERRGEAVWEEYDRESSRKRQGHWVREKAAKTSSHVGGIWGLGRGG